MFTEGEILGKSKGETSIVSEGEIPEKPEKETLKPSKGGNLDHVC